jgi:hypothetical protein
MGAAKVYDASSGLATPVIIDVLNLNAITGIIVYEK